MWGGASIVAIVAVIVGVRFAMMNSGDRSPGGQPTPGPVASPPPASSTVPPAGGGTPARSGSGGRGGSSGLGGIPPGVTAPPPPLVVAPPPADVPPPSPSTSTVRATTTAPVAPVRDRFADQYTRAKAAFDSGSLATAIPQLEAIQQSDPNYRDVSDLLARARAGVAAAVKQAMDAAARFESSGDLAQAMAQLDRVSQIDPSMAIVAEQSRTRIKARMKTEGNDAFRNARQYDALERVDDAVKWYEQAVRLLPDDDPNKKIARQRLDQLRKK
jgi:hypothetical protein